VKHSAATGELRRLALVARALRQMIESFLAWDFKSDGLKRYVHNRRAIRIVLFGIELLELFYPP
jgi:hypothetical protein